MFHLNQNGYITNWLVIGPFSDTGSQEGRWEEDYLKAGGGENKACPKGGDKVGLLNRWEPLFGADDKVDLLPFFKENNIVCYLFTYVVSPNDREAVLAIGSDDGAKMWLNGSLIYNTRIARPAIPDQEKVLVVLKKGTNHLLIKLEQYQGAYAIYLRFLGRQDQSIFSDLQIEIPILETKGESPKEQLDGF
ncbi:MAG: hypothetical protein HY606_12870 [Planctomycetes bacterium]|nr:hypothetical protein [Planctomycetota bacterium]